MNIRIAVRNARAVLAVICLLGGGPAQAAGAASSARPVDLESTVARYDVSFGPFVVGEFTRTIVVDDNERYRIESNMVGKGIAAAIAGPGVSEISDGLLLTSGPRPERYHYKEPGKDRDWVFVFNRDNKTIESASLAKPLSLPDGVQDDASHLLGLRAALSATHKSYAAPVLRASKGEIYEYRFQVVSEESVATGIGQLDALKVERETEHGKYHITLWCASSLNYLPVRIVRTDREGREFVMILADYRTGGRDMRAR